MASRHLLGTSGSWIGPARRVFGPSRRLSVRARDASASGDLSITGRLARRELASEEPGRGRGILGRRDRVLHARFATHGSPVLCDPRSEDTPPGPPILGMARTARCS